MSSASAFRRNLRRFVRLLVLAVIALAIGRSALAATGARLRSLTSFDITVSGVAAAIDPLEPVIPKNIASAVRIVVKAGDHVLTVDEVAAQVGTGFEVRGELSGPGLDHAITVPEAGSGEAPADPLLLALPALPIAGDYALSNIRLVRDGKAVMDVSPSSVTVRIIDQVLVTSVTTRPLTLDEIREKGIVLDSDDYLGFEFTIGLATDSQTVNFSMPVVFDRQGVPVPQVIEPPAMPPRIGIAAPELEPPMPVIVPTLLELDPVEVAEIPELSLRLPSGAPIHIPSVLVIPGNVGYLKQFFSAQLFVANGTPIGSGLNVTDVMGTVRLPPGADRELGTADDPLALPETVRGPQPATMLVQGVGLDGEPMTADDVALLKPGQQGQAEFLIRGEKEGFHSLQFDVDATLEGLPVGPVTVHGKALGGVLVRNPFFDMTFTVPSVVRKGETFSMFATVANIGQGIANDVTVSLDASRMSGLKLAGSQTAHIDTLRTGDAQTLEFKFISERTGKVFATYLSFDAGAAAGGNLKFTLGVGERGIALSPDTLVLPAATDALPPSVVSAAMRVLGQAWSISNAPTGTLPSGVVRVSRAVATEKALALAEAGLRVQFGQNATDAVRDLAFDFYGGKTFDAGFDQLLRETRAGRDFARALGAELTAAVEAAGGLISYGAALDAVAASGADYLRINVGSNGGPAPVTAALTDAGGRRSESTAALDGLPLSKLPGAVWLPIGGGAPAPLVGLFTSVTSPIYTLELVGNGNGTSDLSVVLPRGGGRFTRGTLSNLKVVDGGRSRLVIDLRRPDELLVETDLEGDGTFDTSQALTTSIVEATGARLLSATVIGPETLDGASPFGLHAALLFDRVVDPTTAGSPASYSIPDNSVLAARSQLSGRFVFATLAQPEGPYVATTFASSGVRDLRGARAPPATVPLGCTLEDPGAVVSGKVIGPDGAPVTSGSVTYRNNSNWQCLASIFEADPEVARSGFAATALDANGRYELRYVRQDQCGFPWAMLTSDPRTGALRSVSGFVRSAGEHIVLDIAMLGQGSVSGTVRDLAGNTASGAAVTVVSQTDPQVGGTGVADGDGHYEIFGITVGAVTVNAAKGAGVGVGSGNIARAGGSAVVDVTLDSGGASLSGSVVVVEGLDTRAAAGLSVVFETSGVPVAVALTDTTGKYEFTSLPVGPYKVKAALNTRDRTEKTGILVAGTPGKSDLVIQLPDASGVGGGTSGLGFGKVRGQVLNADGSAAPNAIVSINGRGSVTTDGGTFELTGVAVLPGQQQTVLAQSRDGLRSGTAVALLNQNGQIFEDVTIILSGLGSAELTVLGPSGTPLVGQQVGLLNNCTAACGCEPKVSDANGKVRFDGLPIGTVSVRAVRPGATFVDVADATTSITKDGQVALGSLRFRGSGAVTGVVKNGQGQPVFGADVTLQAPLFNIESCNLGSGVAQRVRTNTLGQYRFENVSVGSVAVSASQVFFPNPASRAGVLTESGQVLSLDLTLSEGASTTAGQLSGTVFLPDGLTPAGAGIEITASGGLPDVVVTTDTAGRYRFAKIFPEGSYSLTVRDPITGGVAQGGVYLRAGQDLTRDLRLLGRGTVAVRVVDAKDHPVSRAFVRLQETSFPARPFEGAIDAANQGVVSFENVFEGPLSVEVTDPNGRGGRASAVLSTPGTVLDVKVTLSITGRISGVFVQPDGVTPIPFGSVTLSVGGRVFGQTTTQGSGSAVGQFAFDNVPAGPFRVEAQDPATARTGFATDDVGAQDEVVSVQVRAQGLGAVEGLVLSNDAPQAGAEVQLVAGSLRASTMSDAAGRYRVVGVPEGPVSVTASLGDGFLSGAASSNLVGDGTTLSLDVHLQDSGSVGGVVLRADGVTPSLPAVVSLQIGARSFSVLTDAQGQFAFERLPSGPATLAVDVLGSIDEGSAAVTVPTGGSTQVTLKLHGVGSLSGIARDSDGNPTSGTVSISGTGSIQYGKVLQVGSDGSFAIPEVLAGPFTASLRVQTATFPLYGSASASVSPGANTFVTVQVQASGSVRGRVLRSNGTVAALGTELTLRRLPDRGSVISYAGSDGRFEIKGVPLGAFELHLVDRVSGGVARVTERELADNGQVLDLGDLVLDDTPVMAVAFDPPDGSLGVAINQPIRVTFSDPLASADGIVVRAGSDTLNTSRTLSADKLTVTLNGTWRDSSEITVTATTSISDVFGRHPPHDRSSRFHTVDLSAPRVLSVIPENGAIEVAGDAGVEVVFDEELAAATDLSTLVIVSGASGAIPGNVLKLAATRVRFTPTQAFADDSTFSVSVNGALDLSGNQQTLAFSSAFRTHDSQPPLLALVQPQTNSWSTTSQPTLVVSLSDSLSGIDAASSTLSIDDVVAAPNRSASALSYTPTSALAEGAHVLAATVEDRAGNLGTLTTELRIDTLPPSAPNLAGVADGDVLIGAVAVSASSTDSGSGVAQISVFGDGVALTTLVSSEFSGLLSTSSLSEGPHSLTARATDQAGNVSAASTALAVIVDNTPLGVAITSPAAGSQLRDQVNVAASVTEPATQVVFSIGGQSVTDTTAPYAATLSLANLPPGTQTLMAVATGLLGETALSTRDIVVDLSAPAPPIAALIFAEPPDAGRSFVHGEPSAVEPGAFVTAHNTNPAHLGSGVATAAANGSFGLQIVAEVGDTLLLTATDAAGNVSEPTAVLVRSVTTLPPELATVRFDGISIDRVSATTLAPDGTRDALFAVDFSMPAATTRQLAFIDLQGPRTLSTRPEVGAPLGVSGPDLGSAFINGADGQVNDSITGNGSLLLFAPAAGFLEPATSYRVTVAFTNGSRFIGVVALAKLPTEEVASASFALRNLHVPIPGGGSNDETDGDPLQPTEVASAPIAVFNGAFGADPVLHVAGAGQPTEVVGATFSIRNERLPFQDVLSVPGGGQPTESVGGLFSISNRQLPFAALLASAGGLQPTDVNGVSFSLLNQKLPFEPLLDALGGLQPSEVSSASFSVNNDPNAVITGSPIVAAFMQAATVMGFGAEPAPSGALALPTLFVSDAVATESDGFVEVQAQLSAPSSSLVKVEYALERISLTPESEYENSSGTLSFAAGETVQTLLLPLFDDLLPEHEEALFVVLAQPTGAALAREEAVVTVLDDEPRPVPRATLFDDFEADQLDQRWETAEPPLLAGGRIAPRKSLAATATFAVISGEVALSGRLRFTAAGQRFGFSPRGADEDGVAYYFESFAQADTGAELGVRAVAEMVDDGGASVRILEQTLELRAGGFADFAIERSLIDVLFRVDGEEVASVPDSVPDALSAGITSAGSDQGPDCDWLQVVQQADDAPACLTTPADMLAWWPADGDTRDLISGLAGSSVAGFVRGRVGQAFSFDAQHPVLTALDTETLVPQAFTVALWVQAGAAGGESHPLVAKPEPAAGLPSYALELDTDNRAVFRLWNGAVQTTLASDSTLTSGGWFHLAATRQADQLSLFVNGVASGSAAFSGDIAYGTAHGAQIELSSRGELLDEVIVYGRALSAAQINEVYQAGSAGYCLP